MKTLKIAQLVLPWIALPPKKYAGTERIVSSVTEELVKRGHDVTLFSVGESQTGAKLSYVLPQALELQADVMKTLKTSFYPLMHVADCFRHADEFDIIHSHAQFLGLPFAACVKTPSVHTFHQIFRFKTEDERKLVETYKYLPFTSISNAQRQDMPDINFVATVYNGVDCALYSPAENPRRDYLFWAGRMIAKKGIEEAIDVARRTGLSLRIAGKRTEDEYFETKVKPFIDGRQISLIDEADQETIVDLYRHALASLVPVRWNEPFGLTPVESMACGTPVVAYAMGGVAETVVDGITGYLIDPEDRQAGTRTVRQSGIRGLADAVVKLKDMKKEDYDRMCAAARKHAVDSFSIGKMVDGYERVYGTLLQQRA